MRAFCFILALLSLLVAFGGDYVCTSILSFDDPKIALGLISVLYMFIPAITVAFIGKLRWKQLFMEYRIRIKTINICQAVKYILVATFLLPLLGIFFTYCFGNLLGWSDFGQLAPAGYLSAPSLSDRLPAALSLLLGNPFYRLLLFPVVAVIGGIAGCTINLVFALGEEIAWRGFMENELRISRAWKPLVIGIIWGLWHAPLILLGFNYGEYCVGGIFVMVLICISLSYFFSSALNRSGSLLTVGALHGIFNTNIVLFFIKPGNPLLSPPVGVIMVLAISIINMLFYYPRKARQ